MASVARTLFDLKEAGEDFEWYPTTDAMLSVVARDIRKLRDNRYGPKTSSILDIGAGDGRALEKLQQLSQTDDRWESVYFDNLFAIEKSLIHLANMPKQIVVIGTEFSEQTLVDKEVDIVFCNPPYSEYENWVCRILRECAANIVYLVIPRRWRECQRLTETVKDLELTAESLGEYDFETADRRARAKIEIVRFQFEERSEHAAFDEAIQAMLPELDRFEMQDDETTAEPKWDAKQLATGGNLIDSLVSSYDAEQAELYETYRAVVKINPRILKELGVTKANILEGLRSKIKGLKNKYWEVLFEYLHDVKKRFATKQRRAFLESLRSKTVIDFTHGNVRSMLIWISKWSTEYCDEQLIELFKSLASHCNVKNYKSNAKVFVKDRWRYRDGVDPNSHYRVDYRLVVDGFGGINDNQYSWRSRNGLEERAHDFLSDFITIANNLGFACIDRPENHQWAAGKKISIWFADGEELMDVRAFKNGNIHIRVNKRLMLAINVQVGKLLGWIHTAEEAVRELEPEAEDVAYVQEAFRLSNQIEPTKLLRIEQRKAS